MKKYINKLFEKLGYVPKRILESEREKLEYYKQRFRESRAIDTMVAEGNPRFSIIEEINYYAVIAFAGYSQRAIKIFNKKDNPYYARICAEELCEMLNEKY